MATVLLSVVVPVRARFRRDQSVTQPLSATFVSVPEWSATLMELGRLEMGPAYPGPNGAFSRPVEVPVNALLLRDGATSVLVDSGSGVGDGWWPGANGLDGSLARARCDPASVRQIILTHLDFDHVGGVLTGRWPD